MAWEGQIDTLQVGFFSNGSLNGWESKQFKGVTDYQLISLDGLKVLKAESKQAASGLYFEQKIDLVKTPVLHWRWRVDKPLAISSELSKKGDDFVARVYVVKSGGLTFWKHKAVNYVWASGQAKAASWPNPFAGDHVMMLAVRSAADKPGQWYEEKRNVREDFIKLTGEAVDTIDAVAIMTDTDNAGGHAIAYYGDIYFTAD